MSMSKLPYSKFSAHLTTNTRPTYATCSLCHYDVKAIYRAKLDNENAFHERRIITKILKLNKNIQYSYAMTKPMPTGCIKEHLFPSWLEFNLFLETIDLEDQIGHLFVVDIEFDEKIATERGYMYNEILPPIIEKQKNFRGKQTFGLQTFRTDAKNVRWHAKTYRCTKKSHVNMFPKYFILLYLEDLSFLIKRCCWRVTKIYTHYTFEQARFIGNFVLMNQISRQYTQNAIEKDFLSL